MRAQILDADVLGRTVQRRVGDAAWPRLHADGLHSLAITSPSVGTYPDVGSFLDLSRYQGRASNSGRGMVQ